MVSVRIVVEPRDRQALFVSTVRFVALFGALGNVLAAALSSQRWFVRALWAGQAVFLDIELVVKTPDREVVVASEQTERDARYLATLIDAARGNGPETPPRPRASKTS